MGNNPHPEPRRFLGVTISSTFTDLEQHRVALIKSIKAHGLTDVAMENDSAKLMDVIDSSLQMVRDGSAYIGVISKKYGQVPRCPIRNLYNLSITELEFNEAVRLRRPVLLFIMDKNHLVHEEDIETNKAKKKKLDAFRDRAKAMGPDTSVHRVYATFNSLEDFKDKISPSVADLYRHLEKGANFTTVAPITGGSTNAADPIPKPPALYAEPPYIGSHKFVGREAQIETLNDWARPAGLHPILLIEAIGGNGKSMLTWEWTTNHAVKMRGDWAGIFWYSFYEKGAVMADFCQRALAYITGQSLEAFRKKKTGELREPLLHHLKDRPWLFILDGLERVLVSYHRIDAAEVADEELNAPTDKIASRDPCSCINDDDDDLLRSLASAAPSKLLVSSRLIPRVLLNSANQLIPGVQRISLPGLRPDDAEELFRSCDITGDSEMIQNYLTTNCNCHPLTTGVLAGLVNNYLPDKGNFDAWVGDPSGGGQLNLANLDLIQKRNHILKAGLHALSEQSRQLLFTLALLSEAVNYSTLSALNPHLFSKPDEVSEFAQSEGSWDRKYLSDLKKTTRQQRNEKELAKTIRDLELRGLLQYDSSTRRYDLHPVIRGVAVGSLQKEEKEQYGQRIVDYVSSQPHVPYEQVTSIEDLRNGIIIVQTLLKMGHYKEAYTAYAGDFGLGNALLFNVEAYKEVQYLIRPFFPNGWSVLPNALNEAEGSYLANDIAMAMDNNTSELKEGLAAYGLCILQAVKTSDLEELEIFVRNVSINLHDLLLFGAQIRVLNLSLAMADASNKESLFLSRLFMFRSLSCIGQWSDAEDLWNLIDPMGRNWSRKVYRPGDAEYYYARFKFWKEDLKEQHLISAERLVAEGKNGSKVRLLHGLRGVWRIQQGEWQLAANSLNEAVQMARAIGQSDLIPKTWHTLAKYYLGQLPDPLSVAEQLAQFREPAHRPLAELWLALGNQNQAKKHALESYKWAWASGEPYVHRYELNKSTELLTRLGIKIPELPPYDPVKNEKFPWEDKVAAFIEKIKVEKKAESHSTSN